MVINSFKTLIFVVVIFSLVLKKVSLEKHLPRDKRSSCPSEDWSSWINNDSPSTGDGEYEKMDPKMRTSFCPLGSIQSAKCVDVSFASVVGVKYTCDAVNGLVCRNADNGHAGCPDMKIQYKCTIPCPPTTPLLVVTTTQSSSTMSTPTKVLTSVTPVTTPTSAASSPLTYLLLLASTTTTVRPTISLETLSFTRTVATKGLPVNSTSPITVSNSTTSVVSSAAVRTTRALDPSDLPTSTVMLVTGTSSTSMQSTVLTSTRKVPLSISTKGYTDLFVSLNSTSFKSTLEKSQSDVEPANTIGNAQKETKALETWPIHATICGVLFLITFLLVIKICIMSRKERKLEADSEDPARMRQRKGRIQQVHPHLNF